MKAGTFVCMVIVRHYVCVFVGVCMFMRKVNLIEVEKKADGNLRITKEVNVVPMEKVADAVVKVHLGVSHRPGSELPKTQTRTYHTHRFRYTHTSTFISPIFTRFPSYTCSTRST